jgi:hypothetical protein
MYPELFERNVNGSRSSITYAEHGLFSRTCSNFRQFAVLSGCRRAGLHEAVKSEFVTVLWRNPDVCEDYCRAFSWGSPTADERRMHIECNRGERRPCCSTAIMLVCATANLVQGDGELNPVTLLTYFCR